MFLLLPEGVLAAMALLFFCCAFGRVSTAVLGGTALLCAVLALVAAGVTYDHSGLLFYDVYQVDTFSQTFKILISLGLCLVVWLGMGLRGVRQQVVPEYYLFLSLSCLGLFIMASAVELLTIVVSLEISSYALYVLIPLRRESGQRAPLEASIKYILFGGIATGISLYGMSYLFGLGHSTYLADLAGVLPRLLQQHPLAVIGFVMLLCGLLYKLALFPMHFWMPDVYVGAANETTCFVATLPKIGAVALLVRLVSLAGGGTQELLLVLMMMAVFSMTLGNFSALGQHDIKRLLAYSSIAHAGYIMIAILSLNELGLVAAIYYIYGYLLMNVACFYVIYCLAPQGENVGLDDLKGLYRRSPLLAAILAVGAMGLSGIPPTIGFTGKFLIFTAALQQKHYWLVGIAVANVCLSAFYYLKLVRAAYSSVERPGRHLQVSLAARGLGWLIMAAIVAGGIFPQNFIKLTKQAIRVLLHG